MQEPQPGAAPMMNALATRGADHGPSTSLAYRYAASPKVKASLGKRHPIKAAETMQVIVRPGKALEADDIKAASGGHVIAASSSAMPNAGIWLRNDLAEASEPSAVGLKEEKSPAPRPETGARKGPKPMIIRRNGRKIRIPTEQPSAREKRLSEEKRQSEKKRLSEEKRLRERKGT